MLFLTHRLQVVGIAIFSTHFMHCTLAVGVEFFRGYYGQLEHYLARQPPLQAYGYSSKEHLAATDLAVRPKKCNFVVRNKNINLLILI